MNKYVVTGNTSDECRDTCYMIYVMYWKFLINRGAIVKVFYPQVERLKDVVGCGGGGTIEDRNEIGFETDFDLDIVCGYHRVTRISPFDIQGRRQTTFPLLSKWNEVPIKYPIEKSIMSLVLQPYTKMVWDLGGEKKLDILGDDVTKVLQGAIPWPETETETEK